MLGGLVLLAACRSAAPNAAARRPCPDPDSCARIGWSHEHGLGVGRDLEAARRYYVTSCVGFEERVFPELSRPKSALGCYRALLLGQPPALSCSAEAGFGEMPDFAGVCRLKSFDVASVTAACNRSGDAFSLYDPGRSGPALGYLDRVAVAVDSYERACDFGSRHACGRLRTLCPAVEQVSLCLLEQPDFSLKGDPPRQVVARCRETLRSSCDEGSRATCDAFAAARVVDCARVRRTAAVLDARRYACRKQRATLMGWSD